MSSVIVVLVTLAVIVLLLNRKVQMCYAMFVGSVVLFLLSGPTPQKLTAAIYATITSRSTWEIILALYFVMCLEYQLRTSGVIVGLMSAARRLFRSERIVLAMMPAFLGFLPSLGGAIFSAPLVENAAKRFDITAESKTAINYWFRHVWEFTNPIMTGMLLASQISGILLTDLISNMAWVTIVSILVGWMVLIYPLKYKSEGLNTESISDNTGHKRNVVLAIGPIIANLVFVVFFKMSPSISMALVVASMVLLLRQEYKDIRGMLIHALDSKLLFGVAGILFFQNVLRQSGVIGDIAVLLNNLVVPTAVIIGIIAFFAGLLTGTSQGFVAITFPFIAELAPGNIELTIICFVLGMAGQMLSPAHLCLLVTIDYFKADFVKTLRPILLMEIIMVLVTYGVITIFW